MRLEVDIEETKIDGFSQRAKAALQKSCKSYTLAIVEEAKIIEQAGKIGNSEQEVVAAHVEEACKNYCRPTKRKTSEIVTDVVLELFLLFAGALFDLNEMKTNTGYLVLYLVVGMITTGLLVAKYWKGR